VADDFDGMDASFTAALQGLMGACGLTLTSGFRTYDEQAALYAQKPNLAAPPGRSNHEDGMAADIAGDLDCAHRRAAEFGLRFPMDH
jgi:LAS superfamily LD-carboxypeptidase LdcB